MGLELFHGFHIYRLKKACFVHSQAMAKLHSLPLKSFLLLKLFFYSRSLLLPQMGFSSIINCYLVTYYTR